MKKQQPRKDMIFVPNEVVERRIHLIRGQKVILDADLAELYRVTTGNLNLAVRRNTERFPEDFMFQLTEAEFENLRLQSATSRWGGRRYQPYAFTEHGVTMLCSVLSSPHAVQMNILVVRAFVKLREVLANHKDLAVRIERIEAGQEQHASVINILAEEIEGLKQLPAEPPKRRIGFSAAKAERGGK
jgi:hypothetical protein